MPSSNKYKSIYFSFIWHGAFLALTLSMLDLNTIFPDLVSRLTPSGTLFGILYAVMVGAPLLLNLVFSHFLRYKKRKKPFLLLGIYLRSLAFLGMGLTTYFWGVSQPSLALFSYFIWVLVFSISAGFAGISYSDILGKLVDKEKRTDLFAKKQLASSLAAFAGGFIIKWILGQGLTYPLNYSLTLVVGFVGLLIASLGFLTLEEPDSILPKTAAPSLFDYLKKVPDYLKKDPAFKQFILVENLASFSLMVLPFYLLFAKDSFDLDPAMVGTFLIFQVVGTIVSNLFWSLFSKHFKAKQIVMICLALGGMIPLLALAAATTTPAIYKGLFLLVGFIVSGRKIGFDAYLLDIAPDDQRTEYLGIRGSLNILRILLPILAGVVIDQAGYTLTFILVALAMGLAEYLLIKK